MKALLCLVATSLMIASVAQRSYGEEIVSFHPLFVERDAVLVPEIEGLWEFDVFGVDTISFARAGDNFYDAVLRSGGITSRFEAVFTELGGSLFLDLIPNYPTDANSGNCQEYSVPVHSCVRMAVIGDTMWLADIQYRWFHEHIIAKNSMGNYLLNESKVILTLPTDDLRAFFTEHLREDGFLREDMVARRLERAAIDSSGSTDRKMKSANAWTGLIPTGQGCVPSFPCQDGWLGGDGGLPVPISTSETVWLFGDTYVGRKDQKNLQGASMVTTIGVSTCDGDGKMKMRYYWRNMYEDHPDHFFLPHTNRYRFWPLSGFMHDEDMYVILSKIGPLLGSSPDNIFNWSVLGTTLAKVASSEAISPLDWKIDLIPWSRALDANLYQGGFAQDSSFAYFFMVKNERQNYLLRIPLHRLESPDGNMEYFSQNGIWKAGSDSSDAKILFEDQLISRVVYVPG
ncbi:MAG: hypothetical protein PHU88_02250 [candidate division Zixibacteria bacterium]|nr:hypothetical protein [candidate division Zixibacteria bacterium]